MNHITEVEHDPYLGEFFIKIPDDVLVELKIKEGDEVEIQLEDNSIVLKKV